MGSVWNDMPIQGASEIPPRLYSPEESFSVDDFDEICKQKTSKEDYRLAKDIQKNIPIYDARLNSYDDESLLDEWNQVLLRGPGVFVLQNMYSNPELIDRVNRTFERIIERESCGGGKGDHFAAGGKNSRIWNSFSKHCLEDPDSFVTYYSNPWLARVCHAWLGPSYRVTAQANIVKPGGKAQVSHRDYHLGFQSSTACAQFPKALQIASQLLTLQGAVAHTDMPVESGPTRFLPFSQTFEQGYMAYRLPHFVQYFERSYVSLPLCKGDGVFFNPALFHAAGENQTTDIYRSANLIQVSSAFGKTMETVDTIPLVERCWPQVQRLYKSAGSRAANEVSALIAALGEGYPFPTNLDKRPPAPGGMAPSSEQDILWEALEQGLETANVVSRLAGLKSDSLP